MEEKQLWKAYFKEKSIVNRNKLVEFYMEDAVRIAAAYHNPNKTSLTVDEFISIGYEYLIKAVELYKPNSNSKFTSFLYTKITGGILQEIRDISLSRTATELSKYIKTIQNEFYTKNGRPISEEETCDIAGINMVRLKQIQGLDKLNTITDMAYDTDTPFEDDALNQCMLQEQIEQLKDCLDKDSWNVLNLYYGEELSKKKIAENTYMSIKKINRILKESQILIERLEWK